MTGKEEGLPGIITLMLIIFMFQIFLQSDCAILKNDVVFDGNEVKNNDKQDLVHQLRCYDKIDKEMLKKNEIFELKTNQPKICLIFLPENVIVNYQEINFSSKKTFTRVLTGHKRGTVSYTYFPVFSHNVTDDFGPFYVKCPFGVIAFHPHGYGGGYPNVVETIKFSLTTIKNPVIWSSECPPPTSPPPPPPSPAPATSPAKEETTQKKVMT